MAERDELLAELREVARLQAELPAKRIALYEQLRAERVTFREIADAGAVTTDAVVKAIQRRKRVDA